MTAILKRRLALVALVTGVLMGVLGQPVLAQVPTEQVAPEGGGASAEAHEDEHAAGWMPTVAKVFNFLVLIGVLTYFLKSSVVAHLAARHALIRRALVEAKSLRDDAERQLASIRARLAELPGELRTLEARGQEELKHEQARLQQATADERQKLIARTRKEIDLQLRVARRELIEHTADVAMGLARTRIEQQMTPTDQARLIDRYAREVSP